MQISLSAIRQAIAHDDGECRAVGDGCTCASVPAIVQSAFRSPGGRRLLNMAHENSERFRWAESVIAGYSLPPRGDYQPVADRGGMTRDEEGALRYACLHEAGHVAICLNRGVRVTRAVVHAGGSGFVQHAQCAPLDEERICLAGLAAVFGSTSLLTLFRERDVNGAASDFDALLRLLRLSANLAQARARGLPLRYGIKLDCDFPDEQLIENREEEFDFVRQLLAEHDDFVLTISHALFERRELSGEQLTNAWARHVAGRL